MTPSFLLSFFHGICTKNDKAAWSVVHAGISLSLIRWQEKGPPLSGNIPLRNRPSRQRRGIYAKK